MFTTFTSLYARVKLPPMWQVLCFFQVSSHAFWKLLLFFSLYEQKKTADDFIASNDEESDDEGVEEGDEEGKKVKKPKVKKERKR